MTQNCFLKTALFTMLAALFMASTSLRAQTGASQQFHWAELDDAQLKLDGKPPLTWGVYQPDKKSKKKGSDIVLVLVGRRYMMLDLKTKLVYLVFPSDLHAQGQDFESDDLANVSNLIPSADWSVRDVGPAELIRLTLGDYGRVLDVSIPHLLDLTSFY